ncbi:alpha/beta hydrolase fold protein [Kribbella flavida DSM 17836]|uniref:prolyl aminopeptidase n=1 Tax=Kribbella flavida (strain DSM 17836 / JCM 10339 / NBRC 14399) TaxID=479435 RepID=D2PQ83_KRIFD|nr:alpha/beta fold hydrolase [Kribbella flavida]ADB34785.1 alpha/beta hydrolase fold protein [Kribbella flavida DSM 17836]
MRHALVAALVLSCSAAACSDPPKESVVPQDRQCAGISGFTCTTLSVPLDHSKPTGRQLELAVAAANNTDAPRGVLLMLTGGPGQPGVPLLPRIRDYLDPAVLEEYQLVMFDQRGTGSRGIDCPELQAAVGGSDFLTPPADAVEACARTLGSSINFYGTPDTVEDIELLRRSLARDQLTLNGTSYGSFTAAQYGLKYPNRVRSLVLDSVVPHIGFDPFGADLMAHTRTVLAAACRRDPACTTDPVADLAWLVRHGELDGSPVNGTSLIESLSILSLNSVNPSLEGLPKVLHDARQGDTAALKELFQRATSRGLPYDELSAGLHLATLCSDLRFPWKPGTPPGQRAAAVDAAISRLDRTELHPYDVRTARSQLVVEGCLRWPATRVSTYPPARELLPRTLILHGGNDLFCPTSWAEWERDHARQAHLVVVPSSGHGVQRSQSDRTGKTQVSGFLLG